MTQPCLFCLRNPEEHAGPAVHAEAPPAVPLLQAQARHSSETLHSQGETGKCVNTTLLVCQWLLGTPHVETWLSLQDLLRAVLSQCPQVPSCLLLHLYEGVRSGGAEHLTGVTGSSYLVLGPEDSHSTPTEDSSPAAG